MKTRCSTGISLPVAGILTGWLLLLAGGCETNTADVPKSIGEYRDRMLAENLEQAADETGSAGAGDRRVASSPTIRPVAAQSGLPERQSLMTTPATTTFPAQEQILAEIPDPVDAPRVFEERARRLEETARDSRAVNSYRQVTSEALELLKQLERPKQVRLSQAECIQRALQNSYNVRFEAYNPAISQTRLVEAEAAFDAEFFLDSSWDKQDQPSSFAFNANKSDTRSIQGGFRKLLPTGLQVSTTLSESRNHTDLSSQFVTLNPSFPSNFVTTFTQPLLRGFGLDVNRAQINISRADHQIAQQRFLQQVRQTLFEVEQAYWRLVQVRGEAVNQAESAAQNHVTYLSILARKEHDATPVEIANSESRWRSRYVAYLETVKIVRDAEDALRNLLNDPELKLSDEIELVPTATPFVAPLALDQFAEVRTALDRRSEIVQARLAIGQARIATAAAKNQTLPQLDLNFQYEVRGLGDTGDNSFDNLTTNRFRSYAVSVSFSYPLGNRARRAAYTRTRLQESQAIVGLHRATDAVVQEVNNTVRTLNVRCTQIPPQFEAVVAAVRNLRALQARTQAISPAYMETELNAVEQVANTRTQLLGVIADYNIAIVNLERAKGTLLEYDHVVVTDEPFRR